MSVVPPSSSAAIVSQQVLSESTDDGRAATSDESHRRGLPLLKSIIELSKPGVTRLVLVTTALGVFAAPHGFHWGDLFATIVGTALVVAGANALNMFLERNSDRFMTRTKTRPLPSGRLRADDALTFGMVVSVAGLYMLAQFVSMTAVALAAFALIAYVLLYTPMKRIHSSALYVGAVPGAMPPAIGYAALTGTLDGAGLCLFLILFAWQLPHFLAITLFRKEEYARAGLRVLPNEKGDRYTKWTAVVQSVFLLGITLLPLRLAGISPVYAWVAMASGLVYLGWAVWGLRADAGVKWAKSFFFASMPHLVIVMTALVLSVQ